MTLKTWSFNSTDGTTVTVANSGLASIVATGGSTVKYATAAASQGSTGIEFISAGTSASYAVAALAADASQVPVSLRFKIPAALPSSAISLAQINDTTGNGRILQLQYTASGKLVINDKSNVQSQILSAAQAVAGMSVRVELVLIAISATAGSFTARAYNSSGTQVGTTAASTTANTGTNLARNVWIGIPSSIAATVDIDSLQVNDGSASEIGEYVVVNTPPTIAVGADVDQTGFASVLLSATANPASGRSIDHYNWSALSYPPELGAAPAITNSSQPSAQFTPPNVTGRYQFQVTATDDNGNTSTPGVQTVYIRGTIVEIIDTVENTGPWVISDLGNLTDSNDATDLMSPASATSGATFTGVLAPLISSLSSFTYTVKYKLDAAASGVTFKVRLIDGNTVRKEWTPTAPTTTAQSYDCTLTSGEIATVTDWLRAKIQFVWTTTN